MRVSELYKNTKAMFFEKPSSTIYDNYLIPNLNRVLVECFEYNNMERMFRGKKPLETVPLVTSFADEVEYEDIYINHIIPLGLSAYLLIDDDLSKYSIYITDYKNELIKNQKIISQEKMNGIIGNTEI